MRLTKSIITVVLCVPVFGACAVVQSPVGPSVDSPTRRVEIDVVGVENAPAPAPAPTLQSSDPTSAEFQACLAAGGNYEECANPPEVPPGPGIPPDADSVEGGAPAESTAGTPYFGE